MDTDTKGRRLQWAKRQPRKKLFVWQEADYKAFELMDRHGLLPSSYIVEHTKDVRPDATQTKNRLTDLFHGSLSQGHFLERPEQQTNQRNAHARHVVSGLAPKARSLLDLEGRSCAVPPTGSAHFIHQLFQGCVGASFELCVPEGLTYLSRSEVLLSDKAGQCKDAKNPMAIPCGSRTLTPDDLFALQFPDGKKTYYLVEIDRSTESMEGKSYGTYFATKLEGYHTLYRTGGFKAWFGFNRPRLLIVTTNPARERLITKYLAKFDAQFHDKLFVTHEDAFGANWYTPAALFSHLYEEPWRTPGGERYITD